MTTFSEKQLREDLEEWGREYRLGDVELLGHQSKNFLYDLIKFAGRVPKATGYKPEPENTKADAIERAVHSLSKVNIRAAVCLRANYCGRGRVVEKAEIASEMLKDKISVPSFKQMVRLGEMYVAGSVTRQAA